MINSISSNVTINYTLAGSTRHTMSTDQKSAVESILSKYDASSITREEAQEISDSFKELEIRPSSDLRETIENAGFDANRLRELSGVEGIEGKLPPPPPPPLQNDSEEISILEEILAEILNSEDEETTTLSQSEQIMDYTSRIMNLTDDAKNEIKNLFDKFKPGNETEYSQKESKNIVTNSLKSILGDYDNYNHVTFYG